MASEFLPFGTGGGANVISQAAWAALAARTAGFSSGVAESDQLNKAWRQGAFAAATLFQFIFEQVGGASGADDGDLAGAVNDLESAIDAFVTAAIGSASEANAGIAEVATQAETNAGTDDGRIVTPLKLRNAVSAMAGPKFLIPTVLLDADIAGEGWKTFDLQASVGDHATAAIIAVDLGGGDFSTSYLYYNDQAADADEVVGAYSSRTDSGWTMRVQVIVPVITAGAARNIYVKGVGTQVQDVRLVGYY